MKPVKKIFLGLLLLMAANLTAQNIYIYPEQPLEFGDFTLTDGGTVTVSSSGERSSSGTVQLLNSNHHPAVFRISTDNPIPIEIMVEVSRELLVNDEGTAMMMASVTPAVNSYIIQAGKPINVVVGGTIQMDRGTFSAGEFRGNISITVTPNSE